MPLHLRLFKRLVDSLQICNDPRTDFLFGDEPQKKTKGCTSVAAVEPGVAILPVSTLTVRRPTAKTGLAVLQGGPTSHIRGGALDRGKNPLDLRQVCARIAAPSSIQTRPHIKDHHCQYAKGTETEHDGAPRDRDPVGSNAAQQPR